jgi:RNA polymerase subunit RPABC4/transcription elongation factor Spt4
MAKLVKCKGCGEEISKNAKACPKCGEPAPAKTSTATWLFLIILVLFMFVVPNIKDNSTSVTHPNSSSPKEKVLKLVFLENFTPKKSGFGNIMESDFKIVNKSQYSIKDIQITCEHYAKSGTKIDSNERIIYEIIKAGKTKNIKNFNMGFIHTQAAKTGCVITNFEILN